MDSIEQKVKTLAIFDRSYVIDLLHLISHSIVLKSRVCGHLAKPSRPHKRSYKLWLNKFS